MLLDAGRRGAPPPRALPRLRPQLRPRGAAGRCGAARERKQAVAHGADHRLDSGGRAPRGARAGGACEPHRRPAPPGDKDEKRTRGRTDERLPGRGRGRRRRTDAGEGLAPLAHPGFGRGRLPAGRRAPKPHLPGRGDCEDEAAHPGRAAPATRAPRPSRGQGVQREPIRRDALWPHGEGNGGVAPEAGEGRRRPLPQEMVWLAGCGIRLHGRRLPLAGASARPLPLQGLAGGRGRTPRGGDARGTRARCGSSGSTVPSPSPR